MAMVAGGCVYSSSLAAPSAVLKQTKRSVIRSSSVSWNRSIQQQQQQDGSCSASSSSLLLLQRSTTVPVQNETRGVVCQVAVRIGDAQSSEGERTNIGPGTKIKVKIPLTVYHVGKSPNLNLEGLEGEVKEHIVEWKGKTVSATFPYKVQFFIEVDGKKVKFFAHLRDDEFDVVE